MLPLRCVTVYALIVQRKSSDVYPYTHRPIYAAIHFAVLGENKDSGVTNTAP